MNLYRFDEGEEPENGKFYVAYSELESDEPEVVEYDKGFYRISSGGIWHKWENSQGMALWGPIPATLEEAMRGDQ